MMKKIQFSLILTIFVVLCALAYSEDFKDSVKDGNKAFMDAAARHDAIALAALYHKDARVLPPNHEMVKGRDDIQDLFKGILTPAITAITLDSEDTEKEDDLG